MGPDAPTAGLNGYWPLDDGVGSAAADASGNGHPGSLVSGPAWIAGQVGGALAFDGSSQSVDIAAPIVTTNQSFTVSAWLRVDNMAGWRTAVSQDGANISGFFLQKRGDDNRFALAVPAYDSTAAPSPSSSQPSCPLPTPGTWSRASTTRVPNRPGCMWATYSSPP